MASQTQTPTQFCRTTGRILAVLAALTSFQLLHANQTVLNWSDNSDNEDGFSIERSVSGGAFEVLAQVGANVATYTDTEIEAGLEYQYRVNAFNTFGYSGYTNVATHYVNVAPTVGTIEDVSIGENETASGIAITVEDFETGASELDLSISSSNSELLDAGGIVLGGTGTTRTLELSPKVNAAGESTILVSVSDGVDTVETSFVLTVSSLGFPTVDFAIDSISSNPRAGETFSIVGSVSDASKVSSISYLVNEELVASSVVAPYSVDLTLPSSGTYTVTAVASLVGRDETVSVEREITVGEAPAASDLVAALRTLSTDEATSAGTASYDLESDTFYLEDEGGQISGSSDTHRFFYLRVDGDVSIQAKVGELLASSDQGVGGLMLRSALYGKSAQSSLLINGAGNLEVRSRASRGESVESVASVATGLQDVWLKLERIGDTVKAYYKNSEEAAWSLARESQISLEDPIFVGFAVAAGPGDSLAAATFTQAVVNGQILAWDETSTKPEMPGSLIISQAAE